MQPLEKFACDDVDNLEDMLLFKLVENNGIVNPVKKLRIEYPFQSILDG